MNARPALFGLTLFLLSSAAAAACDCDTWPFRPESCVSVCRATALSKAGDDGLTKLGYESDERDQIRGKSPKEIENLLENNPKLQEKIDKRLEGIRATGVDKIR